MIFILAGNIPALAAPVPTSAKDAAKPQEIKKQINDIPEKTQIPEAKDEAKEKPKPNEAQKNAANDLREQAKFLYNSNKLNESLELFSKIPDAEKISDDWLFLANIAHNILILRVFAYDHSLINGSARAYKQLAAALGVE